MLDALGVFMECAGNSPQGRVLASELLSLIISLQQQVYANVRRAALRALSLCVRAVPLLLLMQDCPAQLDAAREWAEGILM